LEYQLTIPEYQLTVEILPTRALHFLTKRMLIVAPLGVPFGSRNDPHGPLHHRQQLPTVGAPAAPESIRFAGSPGAPECFEIVEYIELKKINSINTSLFSI